MNSIRVFYNFTLGCHIIFPAASKIKFFPFGSADVTTTCGLLCKAVNHKPRPKNGQGGWRSKSKGMFRVSYMFTSAKRWTIYQYPNDKCTNKWGIKFRRVIIGNL
jgi:hypothetical protein